MSDFSHNNIFRESGVAYKAHNEADKVKMIRAGVLKDSVQRLSEITTIPEKSLVEILPVSERQFNRYDNRTRLKKDLSEHILIVADVLLKALEIFDSPAQLREWFFTPQLALGSEKPISLLDTSFGATLVTDVLGRLEHGVVS